MAKQNENLFEESSQGAVSAVTAFSVILSLVLTFGGMVLTSFAFGGASETTDLTIFSAGLAAIILGFAIPFGLLPAINK